MMVFIVVCFVSFDNRALEGVPAHNEQGCNSPQRKAGHKAHTERRSYLSSREHDTRISKTRAESPGPSISRAGGVREEQRQRIPKHELFQNANAFLTR